MINRKKIFSPVVLALLSALALACQLGASLPSAAGGEADPRKTAAAAFGGKRLIDAPGIVEVALLTPQTGAGKKPLLQWQAVAGADRYQLMIYAPDGRIYWAWEGIGTSVYLGGGQEAPAEDASGPTLSAGMSWSVLAFDATGSLIGSSPVRPISP